MCCIKRGSQDPPTGRGVASGRGRVPLATHRYFRHFVLFVTKFAHLQSGLKISFVFLLLASEAAVLFLPLFRHTHTHTPNLLFYFAGEKLVFPNTHTHTHWWICARVCLHIVCILSVLAQSRVPFCLPSCTRTANICAIKSTHLRIQTKRLPSAA